MPYRVDIDCPPADALDRLVELGAVDVESCEGGVAALLPDGVPPQDVARKFGPIPVVVSPAVGRDNDSVWLLSPQAFRLGNLMITPPELAAPSDALRLRDSEAFGTGRHPTTALCLEALEEILSAESISSLLDIGTGTGILALAALKMGVRNATGVDIDGGALQAAAENALLNHLEDRLRLIRGGSDAAAGLWPLVTANILTAPLIEMAPAITRRVGSKGRLILSGIPASAEFEVRKAYEHVGMRHIESKERAGWVMLMMRASW